MSLRAGLDRITAPLARAAAAFVKHKAWNQHGYARLDDHARERFQRSGRWIRDLAAIGRAIDDLPGFLAALTGADGGPRLSLAAARIVATIAGPEDVAGWLRLARSVSVRRLREAATACRARAGDGAEAMAVSPDDGRTVRLPAPLPVRAAFDEALEVFRACEGHELSVSAFIEALLAESLAAGLAGHGGSTPAGPARTSSTRVPAHIRERSFEEASRNWQALRAGDGTDALGDFDPIPQIDDAGDDRALQALLGMRVRLERELDNLLLRMARLGAWPALGFAGLEQYAEERLGMSRSTARERATLQRGLEKMPELRAACERGDVGTVAALEVVRLMRRQPAASPEIRRAWVERARRATVKRLRDEVRALQRYEMDELGPLSDERWHRSLYRRVGDGRARMARLAALARSGDGPWTTLSWRLPAELAARFTFAMGEAARTSSNAKAGAGAGAEAPLWAGLLVMLEDFVGTWDVEQTKQRPSMVAIYVRDGWRCMAPGCTSRRHLENHHVIYRSRGGDDLPRNRVCICRFHHQRGEHGDLARVWGWAPLDLQWSLGRGGRGGAWRNELRLSQHSDSPRPASWHNAPP